MCHQQTEVVSQRNKVPVQRPMSSRAKRNSILYEIGSAVGHSPNMRGLHF
jgi:hypothetical protein